MTTIRNFSNTIKVSKGSILDFCSKLNLSGFSDLKMNISVDYQVQKLNEKNKQ